MCCLACAESWQPKQLFAMGESTSVVAAAAVDAPVPRHQSLTPDAPDPERAHQLSDVEICYTRRLD